MKSIFISYRRQDAQGTVGRLADGLERAFGEKPIFRDVGSISPGVDFVAAINDALGASAALLAVIGKDWLTVRDDAGERRLDDAADFVRLEIETALAREILVIPILVDGAQMPAEKDLPGDLKPLARREAHELTDKRWNYDLTQLVKVLAAVPGLPAPRPEATSGTAKRALQRAYPAVAALLNVAAFTTVAYQIADAVGLTVGMSEDTRSAIYSHATDGGTLLLALAAVAIPVVLVAERIAGASDRVRAWLSSPYIGGAAVAFVLINVPLIATQNRVSAMMVTVLYLAYVALKARHPDARWPAARIAIGVVVAVAAVGSAFWADVMLEKIRAANFDVAFLIPPEPSRNTEATMIFAKAHEALDQAFQGVETFRVVPRQLAPADFARFRQPKEFLAYKAEHGLAGIFIRSRYNLVNSGSAESPRLRILVTPLRRVASETLPVPLDSWIPLPLEARANDEHDVYRAALRTSFELASFLGSQKLIRLPPGTQQKVWRNILREYAEVLQLMAPECADADAIGKVLSSPKTLEQTQVRQLLSGCPADRAGKAIAASDAALDTALAVYRALGAR